MSTQMPPRTVSEIAHARLENIDLIRGFAFLWVTYCHAHASWGQLVPADGVLRAMTRFIGIGGKGVDLFVVVSGFCLFYPAYRRSRLGTPQHSIASFYRRRLNRIVPVYIAAIAFSLAVTGVGYRTADTRGIVDLWPHLLFIQNMMPDYIARINGPLWSIALEMQLYFVFPLLAWLALRGQIAVVLLMAALLSAVAALPSTHAMFAGKVLDASVSYAMPARLIQFTLGMSAVLLCQADCRRWRLALFASVPIALGLGVASVAKSTQSPFLACVSMTSWGIIGCAIVTAAVVFERAIHPVTRLLRPLRFIGVMSFSLYVVHFPIMLAMESFALSVVSGPLHSLWFYTLTGLPLTLLVGFAMFRIVERYTLNTASDRQIIRRALTDEESENERSSSIKAIESLSA